MTTTPTTPIAAETERDALAAEGVRIAQQRHSEGKRAERRLGLLLCAPAAIIMGLIIITVGFLQWPLVPVVLVLAPISVLLSWSDAARDA